MRGKIRYESIKNSTLDLVDIALLNDALDVEAENNLRLQEWKEKQDGN